MRTLLLSLLFFFNLHASEVILSALLGTFKSEHSLRVGDALKVGTDYELATSSKMQILINSSAVVTLSPHSRFRLEHIDNLTCKLYIYKGTYKIFNLAASKPALSIEIKTPTLSIDMHDSIALIKVTPELSKTACAKNTMTVTYKSESTLLKEREMLTLKDHTLKKSPSIYEDFSDVFIKQIRANEKLVLPQERKDPSDLDH